MRKLVLGLMLAGTVLPGLAAAQDGPPPPRDGQRAGPGRGPQEQPGADRGGPGADRGGPGGERGGPGGDQAGTLPRPNGIPIAPGSGGYRAQPGQPGYRQPGGPNIAPGSGGYRPQPGQPGYRGGGYPGGGYGGGGYPGGGYPGGGYRDGGRPGGGGDGYRPAPFRPGPGGNWNRGWRDDRRYDFRGYRAENNRLFHLQPYRAPRGWGYGYRRFTTGVSIAPFLFGEQYWIDDPYDYRLPPAYGPYRWVRYYDDALLVDIRSGVVVDAVYGLFW